MTIAAPHPFKQTLRSIHPPIFLFILFLAVLFTLIHTSPLRAQSAKRLRTRLDTLRRDLSDVFSDSATQHAHWGIYIRSLSKDQLIYEQNSRKNFIPASNQKVLTIATAMSYLDTAFQYTTSIFANGQFVQRDSTYALQGDLVLKSDGNPCISAHWFGGRPTAFFERLADSLRYRRITEITGDLVGDDSDFKPDTPAFINTGGDGDYPKSWEWDDLPYATAAPLSAVSFNENFVSILILPSDTLGQRPSVSLDFPTTYFTIDNYATTGDAGSTRTLVVQRIFGTNRVVITGSLPQDSRGYREGIAAERPTLFAMSVMREVFLRKGIAVRGRARQKRADEKIDYTAIATFMQWRSPPLIDILKYLGKESNNFCAETVLRTVGFQAKGEGSAKAGLECVQSYLRSQGVDDDNYKLLDGSGLSRQNFVAPAAIATLLRSYYKSKKFGSFRGTLPIAGEDGTLRKRMTDTKAAGKVWAKTGFISTVRTLSGYVQSDDGELFCFSMMAMNYAVPTKDIEALQDHALELIANWRRN